MNVRQELIRAAGVYLEDAAGREALARAIRTIAFEDLSRRAPGLADDLAQTTALRVLRAFERGCTTPDRLPAYVLAAARNELRSHQRVARSTREELRESFDEVPPDEAAGSPERDLGDAEEARDQADRLRAALPEMPAPYREAIVAHCVEGRPIDELVEEEVTARLARDGRDPSDALARGAARLNARRTVDQRLSRGRAWLAKRLRDEGGGA